VVLFESSPAAAERRESDFPLAKQSLGRAHFSAQSRAYFGFLNPESPMICVAILWVGRIASGEWSGVRSSSAAPTGIQKPIYSEHYFRVGQSPQNAGFLIGFFVGVFGTP
jgi:hypothetical protein